jgi:hydrogenase nickel incorporation protein HypA/HybF
MHEMSIALSIIDLASKQAREAGAREIKEVELDIGTMSGVELEALNFAMKVAVKNTMLEKSRIKINHITASAECLECGHAFNTRAILGPCPECSALNTRIISGRELQVKSLLIE